MNNPFIIILILVVAPMVLGALLKMFKAYQEEVDRQSQRKRPRSSVPTVPVSSSSASTGRGQGEIDRFLQEIDKLRQKGDSPVKVAPVKAVPVARALPKPARVEPPPFIPSTVTPSRSGPLLDVPVAKVVAPAPPPRPAPLPAATSTAPRVTIRSAPGPTTRFGKDLAALLANKQSVPMAVVLQEILGPPKCRRG
jgi:hypothetical protein